MTHYVYHCYDARGVLLYVGCTNNVQRRMKEHRSCGWGWVPKCVRIDLAVYQTRDEALRGETRSIAFGRPVHNIYGNPAHSEAVERRWGLPDLQTVADQKWHARESLHFAQMFDRIDRLGYDVAAAA